MVSWCAFQQDYYRGVIPVPYTTIMVELDEGPMLLSNPRGLAYDEITLGMAVKVTFIDARDSAGAFRLPVFERA